MLSLFKKRYLSWVWKSEKQLTRQRCIYGKGNNRYGDAKAKGPVNHLGTESSPLLLEDGNTWGKKGWQEMRRKGQAGKGFAVLPSLTCEGSGQTCSSFWYPRICHIFTYLEAWGFALGKPHAHIRTDLLNEATSQVHISNYSNCTQV